MALEHRLCTRCSSSRASACTHTGRRRTEHAGLGAVLLLGTGHDTAQQGPKIDLLPLQLALAGKGVDALDHAAGTFGQTGHALHHGFDLVGADVAIAQAVEQAVGKAGQSTEAAG